MTEKVKMELDDGDEHDSDHDVEPLRWTQNKKIEPGFENVPPVPPGKKREFKAMYERMQEDKAPKVRVNRGRRSEVEINLDLLRAIKIYSLPTRIMYASNLSWKKLTERFEFLIRCGFIRTKRVKDGRTKEAYYLTEKGDELLGHWEASLAIIEQSLREILEDEK